MKSQEWAESQDGGGGGASGRKGSAHCLNYVHVEVYPRERKNPQAWFQKH